MGIWEEKGGKAQVGKVRGREVTYTQNIPHRYERNYKNKHMMIFLKGRKTPLYEIYMQWYV